MKKNNYNFIILILIFIILIILLLVLYKKKYIETFEIEEEYNPCNMKQHLVGFNASFHSEGKTRSIYRRNYEIEARKMLNVLKKCNKTIDKKFFEGLKSGIINYDHDDEKLLFSIAGEYGFKEEDEEEEEKS